MMRTMLAMFVLLIAVVAMAGDAADDTARCIDAGRVASEIAKARDVGVPIKVLRHKTEMFELQHGATPEQQLSLQHIIGAVYSDPGITPEIAAQGVLKGCLRKIHQTKPLSH